jgi:hypothetical protein
MNIKELQKSFPDHVIIGSFFLVSEPDNNIAEMEVTVLDINEDNESITCTMGFPLSDVSKNFLKDWMEYKENNSCDCVMMGINHDVTPPLKRIGRVMDMSIVEGSILKENNSISASFKSKKVHKDFEFYLKKSTE